MNCHLPRRINSGTDDFNKRQSHKKKKMGPFRRMNSCHGGAKVLDFDKQKAVT